MASVLQKLIGLTITRVVELQGYVQLHFGDEIGLTIYNKMLVEPTGRCAADLPGKMLTSIEEEQKGITMNFIDGSRVRIDMRPEAYKGPEALQLTREGEAPVIWN